jgi:hypothetical protein
MNILDSCLYPELVWKGAIGENVRDGGHGVFDGVGECREQVMRCRYISRGSCCYDGQHGRLKCLSFGDDRTCS